MAVSTNSVPQPKLKDYIFTDKLGSGTYATVFKAYRKGGPREVVAVKCVLKTSLNKVSTENLLTEIELLKELKHENIVCLKDFQWDQNYIYLIMEYCNGGDLSRFIKTQRTLSEYLARRFLQEIALALQYMRTKNVSHMDLKPQNILLSSLDNPVIKLGDFGFAHYLIGETDADFLRGSPLYMAPEIVNKRYYNEKADLWSVGVILYESLFGLAPFSSRSLIDLLGKIKDTKPVQLPYGVNVSSKCRDLLLGLLKREPEDRLSFDEFFNHPFIDLDHRPSKESLPKAIALVSNAVEHDSRQEYNEALNYYCQSVQHFVPAIHFERDQRRKESLRLKVKEYMTRAEELKTSLKPAAVKPQVTTTQSASSAASESELSQLSQDHPQLKAALTVISAAESMEQKEDFTGASGKYTLALETLLKVLKEEPKGRRKDLLRLHLSEWMGRAEKIQEYLKVQELTTEDTSLQEEMESKRFYHSVMGASCSIQ